MYRLAMRLQGAEAITGTFDFDDGGRERPSEVGTVSGTASGDRITLKAVVTASELGFTAVGCEITFTGFGEPRNDSLQLKAVFGTTCGFLSGRRWDAVFLNR